MTAVKERLVEMVPRMPLMIADLEEEEAQVVFNILIKREKPKTVDVSKRIGAAKGEFEVPEDFDAGQEEIYAEIEISEDQIRQGEVKDARKALSALREKYGL